MGRVMVSRGISRRVEEQSMPDESANPEAQVHLRDLFALLFAALCGLLLGVAAAPTVLPMLGFAGFAQYVEPRAESLASKSTARTRHAPVPAEATGVAVSSQVSGRRSPSSQRPPHPSPSNRTLALNARARAAAVAAEASAPAPPLLAWLDSRTLFGLALFALAVVVWLRRDMFAVLMCRWAKDPRQWRGAPAPAVVNAKCVLYFEGNAYRLGAEFFSQAVEVRYSPLFVRINMRGSDRAIVMPRRVPRITSAGSLRRRAS